MSANKLNPFHWHITDSHSFPLVVPSEPDLTAKGSYGPDMQYSPDDVTRIVQFSLEHGVRVLPEIDSPGIGHWAFIVEIVTLFFEQSSALSTMNERAMRVSKQKLQLMEETSARESEKIRIKQSKIRAEEDKIMLADTCGMLVVVPEPLAYLGYHYSLIPFEMPWPIGHPQHGEGWNLCKNIENSRNPISYWKVSISGIIEISHQSS
ncbi:hypothetical protein FH972_005053 [Carpinus fangiana]|uniref:beta-N-acetylhexosaminidase n=1 Tax=Carpinus fangiana TaxID=176857 RepID=A0A5N6QQY0_9ROSI|nr:hypothetical protein FH972_005053 [Carpinus fangiana]